MLGAAAAVPGTRSSRRAPPPPTVRPPRPYSHPPTTLALAHPSMSFALASAGLPHSMNTTPLRPLDSARMASSVRSSQPRLEWLLASPWRTVRHVLSSSTPGGQGGKGQGWGEDVAGWGGGRRADGSYEHEAQGRAGREGEGTMIAATRTGQDGRGHGRSRGAQVEG